CYDHLDFLTEPVKLARSLLDQNIHAMKIWPFDPIARENHGQYITRQQIRTAIDPLRQIKEEFGDDMDVAMEFHGFWNLHSAIQIAQACEEYSPMWLEEMLPQDNLSAYAELAAATSLPLCVSERLMTRWQFRELLDNGAARIVMPDISWCGGISEAKKIAVSAETALRPIAPHNCGGPVLHAATLHLAANATNLFIAESVRRHYGDEYRSIVTNTNPIASDGWFDLPVGPGLGVELSPETLARPDAKAQMIR
ncbi:MAG TPA: mandelate racemase/muconate lactonizing enzyme family protein, partial [Bryobacteraceae bacterium]|nr:mandelate racemase/muconate lactonizing enzyme family protein [Bryobacteraceae bacterium]